MLTREQLLAAAADLPTADVDIPAWGGIVRFRGMGLNEKIEFDAAMSTAANAGDTQAMLKLQVALMALTMLGPDGEPMFGGDDAAVQVAKFKPEGFRAALEVVHELNGFRRANEATEGEQSPLADSGETT